MQTLGSVKILLGFKGNMIEFVMKNFDDLQYFCQTLALHLRMITVIDLQDHGLMLFTHHIMSFAPLNKLYKSFAYVAVNFVQRKIIKNKVRQDGKNIRYDFFVIRFIIDIVLHSSK